MTEGDRASHSTCPCLTFFRLFPDLLATAKAVLDRLDWLAMSPSFGRRAGKQWLGMQGAISRGV